VLLRKEVVSMRAAPSGNARIDWEYRERPFLRQLLDA
jgi:hypothetical protein